MRINNHNDQLAKAAAQTLSSCNCKFWNARIYGRRGYWGAPFLVNFFRWLRLQCNCWQKQIWLPAFINAIIISKTERIIFLSILLCRINHFEEIDYIREEKENWLNAAIHHCIKLTLVARERMHSYEHTHTMHGSIDRSIDQKP